ncbi:MAG: hypothetical protein R3C24_10625 [Cyanobacteriota/Melainabacteria group bacterium]
MKISGRGILAALVLVFWTGSQLDQALADDPEKERRRQEETNQTSS